MPVSFRWGIPKHQLRSEKIFTLENLLAFDSRIQLCNLVTTTKMTSTRIFYKVKFHLSCKKKEEKFSL